MLAVPVKRAEQISLAEPLKKFFKKHMKEEQKKYEPDVRKLDELRQYAASVAEANEVSKQALLRYHEHLRNIIPRFSGYEAELRLQFGWGEAFKPTKRTVTTSWYCDQAAMVFNYGALETYQGATRDRSSDEGIRDACKHFQQAAGVFEYIRDELSGKILGACPPELSAEGLNFVIQLCLAQAQACFYEMAVKQRKANPTTGYKPSVIAKLGFQCSVYYRAALTQSSTPPLSAQLDRSWAGHLEYQWKCFAAAAQYWQSLVIKEQAAQTGQGYGEEIARLGVAQRLLEEALAIGQRSNLHESVSITAQNLLRQVTRSKEAAEKDNRTIYMEVVREEATLEAITAVSMVKPAAIPNATDAPENLFADLVPRQVKELTTRFTDAAYSLLSTAEAEATNATNEGRALLSSVGLPGAVEAYKTGGGIPDSLWSKIHKVQEAGAFPALQHGYEELNSFANRAHKTIDDIEASLQREEISDDDFRRRNVRWDGVPSRNLNRDIKLNVDRFRSLWNQARNSDETVVTQLRTDNFEAACVQLGMSRQELDQLMPRVQGAHQAVDTSALERHMVELARLFERRNEALRQLRELVQDEPTTRFMQAVATRRPGEEILQSELRMVEERRAEVSSSIASQSAVMTDLMHEHANFERAKQRDSITAERDRVIRQLEQSSTRYFNIYAQLSAGRTFYSDLQMRLTSLLQASDDLAYTQQLHRQDFEMNIARDYERHEQEAKDHHYAMHVAQQMNDARTALGAMHLEDKVVAVGQPIDAPPTTEHGSYIPPQYPAAHAHATAVPAPQHSGQPGYYPTPYPQQHYSPPAPHVMPVPSAAPSYAHAPPPTAYGGYTAAPAPGYPASATSYAAPPHGAGYSAPAPYAPSSYPAAGTAPYAPAHAAPAPSAEPAPYSYNAPPTYHHPPAQASGDPGMEGKIQRLMEMGFDRQRVINALNAAGGNEQRALDSLL